MHIGIQRLIDSDRPFTLVLSNGFEERTPAAAELLRVAKLRPQRILLIKYPGEEHESSYKAISTACDALASQDKRFEIGVADLDKLASLLAADDQKALIVCDITGLSRVLIFEILSVIARAGQEFWLLYTEAEEYYPKKRDFEKLLKTDPEEAFLNLVKYEQTDIIYSGSCEVEDVPGFSGHHLPNYPLMIIAFLTFKRSRLGAILREYESNKTVLIKAVPVRNDLRWRADVMEIINFDLMEDHRNSMKPVETLDWRATYNVLRELYYANHANYRFNFLLAPLGSKMQTVGAWAFAFRTPDVRVITSTPAQLFKDKYSEGWRSTFLIDDVFPTIAER